MAPVQSDVSPNKRKSLQPTKMPQIPGNRVTKPTSTRTRKAKPGKKALKEIKILQSTTNLLMRKMPFLRVVKEVMDEMFPGLCYRWQAEAVLALQEMAEAYLIALFQDVNLVTLHANRVTIMQKDMQLVRRLRANFESY